MPAPYSTDLRQRIVAAYQANEGSQRELAQRFKVSLSFVRDLLRRYRESGDIKPKGHGGGTQAKLSAVHLEKVRQLLGQNSDLFLHELCEQLEEQCGVRVSVTTMHRSVQHLNLSVKKNAHCQ
ncbi:MAG: transposase [Cyanobacteria bacterium Co-bin8]|nr:transposase [Cyanobacteria bacterium Co-bin8]